MLPVITTIDTANRIQLPADWLDAAGLRGTVQLDRTADGILIRACPRLTWDELSASKLVIGSASPKPTDDSVEVTGDDLLF